MIRPPPSARRFFLGFSLALMAGGLACGSTTDLPPTATVPSVVLRTAIVPAARFLYAADDLSPEMQSEARAWAEGHGLSFRAGPAGAITPAEIAGGLGFVVSLHGAEWAAAPAFIEAGVRGVVVDPAAPVSSRDLSVITASRDSWEQSGFLAGVLVGLIGDARAAGRVGAHEDSEQAKAMAEGFDQGLRYACPRCLEVRQEAASLDVDAFVREGVEGVFVAPGDGAADAARAAADAGLWVVWIGVSPPDVPADHLAARIQFDPVALLGPALDALAAGEDGVTWPYSARSGSLTIEGVRPDAISLGKQRLAQQAWDKLASGELQLVEP